MSLSKNAQGLGITIAGYVGDKNSGAGPHRGDGGPGSLLRLLTAFFSSSESSGIFVKSVTKDSAVDHDGRIHVGDQIIAVSRVVLLNHPHALFRQPQQRCTRLFWLFLTAPVIGNCRPLQVDGVNIQGYTNQQAVEVLRHTGQTVHLKLIRRGFRPEEIPPAVTPGVAIPPPNATIPTPTAVVRELERDGKAEDPANGRGAANASFSLMKSECDFKCRCGGECCSSPTCFPLVLMLRRSSALRFTSFGHLFFKITLHIK